MAGFVATRCYSLLLDALLAGIERATTRPVLHGAVDRQPYKACCSEERAASQMAVSPLAAVPVAALAADSHSRSGSRWRNRAPSLGHTIHQRV